MRWLDDDEIVNVMQAGSCPCEVYVKHLFNFFFFFWKVLCPFYMKRIKSVLEKLFPPVTYMLLFMVEQTVRVSVSPDVPVRRNEGTRQKTVSCSVDVYPQGGTPCLLYGTRLPVDSLITYT